MVRTTGKLPLYLAYGKYVIATDVRKEKKVLPGVGCLLQYTEVRDDTYPSRVAMQLKKLLDQPEVLWITEKAQRVAKNNFDYKIITQRLELLCRNLVESSIN